MEGLLRHRFWGAYLEGLIHGAAYFRNFTVFGARFSFLNEARYWAQASHFSKVLFN